MQKDNYSSSNNSDSHIYMTYSNIIINTYELNKVMDKIPPMYDDDGNQMRKTISIDTSKI